MSTIGGDNHSFSADPNLASNDTLQKSTAMPSEDSQISKTANSVSDGATKVFGSKTLGKGVKSIQRRSISARNETSGLTEKVVQSAVKNAKSLKSFLKSPIKGSQKSQKSFTVLTGHEKSAMSRSTSHVPSRESAPKEAPPPLPQASYEESMPGMGQIAEELKAQFKAKETASKAEELIGNQSTQHPDSSEQAKPQAAIDRPTDAKTRLKPLPQTPSKNAKPLPNIPQKDSSSPAVPLPPIPKQQAALVDSQTEINASSTPEISQAKVTNTDAPKVQVVSGYIKLTAAPQMEKAINEMLDCLTEGKVNVKDPGEGASPEQHEDFKKHKQIDDTQKGMILYGHAFVEETQVPLFQIIKEKTLSLASSPQEHQDKIAHLLMFTQEWLEHNPGTKTFEAESAQIHTMLNLLSSSDSPQLNEQVDFLRDELKKAQAKHAGPAKEPFPKNDPNKKSFDDIFRELRKDRFGSQKEYDKIVHAVVDDFKKFHLANIMQMQPDELIPDKYPKKDGSGPTMSQVLVPSFNRISNAFVQEILKNDIVIEEGKVKSGFPESEKVHQERVRTIKFVINIAETAFEEGDFQLGMSLMTCLNNSSIMRLIDGKYKDELGKEYMNKYEALNEIVSPLGGYKNFHDKFNQILERERAKKPPDIPKIVVPCFPRLLQLAMQGDEVPAVLDNSETKDGFKSINFVKTNLIRKNALDPIKDVKALAQSITGMSGNQTNFVGSLGSKQALSDEELYTQSKAIKPPGK